MTNPNDTTPVAAAILAQLGGRQIFAMAFRLALTTPDGVTLHVAKGLKTLNRIDRVCIVLAPDDTYTVTFHRWNRKALELDTFTQLGGERVYADSLRPMIEAALGLRLTLGTCSAPA